MQSKVKLPKVVIISLVSLLANLFSILEWVAFAQWQSEGNLKILMTPPIVIKSVILSDGKQWVIVWAASHFMSWTLSGISFWYITSLYYAFT